MYLPQRREPHLPSLHFWNSSLNTNLLVQIEQCKLSSRVQSPSRIWLFPVISNATVPQHALSHFSIWPLDAPSALHKLKQRPLYENRRVGKKFIIINAANPTQPETSWNTVGLSQAAHWSLYCNICTSGEWRKSFVCKSKLWSCS